LGLEPSYIRFVYDELEKGKLNAENASSLPQGVTDMYLSEFGAETPVAQREKKLDLFLLWSLIKTDISVQSFSALFNLSEHSVNTMMFDYSKWFNTKDGTHFSLYHDRLKVYLLQLSSSKGIISVEKRVVNYFNSVEDSKLSVELIQYKYHYYHQHIIDLALAGIEEYKIKLIELLYDEDFLNKQISTVGSEDGLKELFKTAFIVFLNDDRYESLFIQYLKVLVNGVSVDKESVGDLNGDLLSFEAEIQANISKEQFFLLAKKIIMLVTSESSISKNDKLSILEKLWIDNPTLSIKLVPELSELIDAQTATMIALNLVLDVNSEKLTELFTDVGKTFKEDIEADDIWQKHHKKWFLILPFLILFFPIIILLAVVFRFLYHILIYSQKGKAGYQKRLKENLGLAHLRDIHKAYLINLKCMTQVSIMYWSKSAALSKKIRFLKFLKLFQLRRFDGLYITNLRIARLKPSDSLKYYIKAAVNIQKHFKNIKQKYARRKGVLVVFDVIDTYYQDKFLHLGEISSSVLLKSDTLFFEFESYLRDKEMFPISIVDKMQYYKPILHLLVKEKKILLLEEILNKIGAEVNNVNNKEKVNVLCEFATILDSEIYFNLIKLTWNGINDTEIKSFLNYKVVSMGFYSSSIFRNLDDYRFIDSDCVNYKRVFLYLIELLLIEPELIKLIKRNLDMIFPELALGSFEESEVPSRPTEKESWKEIMYLAETNSYNEKENRELKGKHAWPISGDNSVENSKLYEVFFERFMYKFNFMINMKSLPSDFVFDKLIDLDKTSRDKIVPYFSKYLIRNNSFEKYWKQIMPLMIDSNENIINMGLRFYYYNLLMNDQKHPLLKELELIFNI